MGDPSVKMEYCFYDQKCPVCKENTLTLIQQEREIELYGPILLSTASCRNCGFRHKDVLPLTIGEPSAVKIRIAKGEDLNLKVVRSSTATVVIPELKAKIAPGPASEGYITTVEGVLNRIEEAGRLLLTSLKGARKEKCKRFLKELGEAKKGEKPFTLIIKDPYGKSAVISERAERRKLTKREIENLRKGALTL